MKKILFVALALSLALVSCTRKNFVKKLTGTWELNRYFYDDIDKTTLFDTTYRDYTITFEEDESFMETWFTLQLIAQQSYDTAGLLINPVTGDTTVIWDTIHYFDSIMTPHTVTGTWELLNSEEDLQLRDTSLNARQYRINELSKNEMKLAKGNEDFYFGKR